MPPADICRIHFFAVPVHGHVQAIRAGLDIANLKIKITVIWSTDPDEKHASSFLFDPLSICGRAMPGQARRSHIIEVPACAADWGHVCQLVGCRLV